VVAPITSNISGVTQNTSSQIFHFAPAVFWRLVVQTPLNRFYRICTQLRCKQWQSITCRIWVWFLKELSSI